MFVHILASIHPSVALADLVRDIKTSTSAWIAKEGLFPGLTHWQDGCGAFEVSAQERG